MGLFSFLWSKPEATTASIPGQLSVSRRKFELYFGKNAGDSKWVYIQKQFKLGCLNPAVVLDAKQGLVAVFSDLANTHRTQYPVVKIIRERLDLISTTPVINGVRFAAVAMYGATNESVAKGRWNDFFPIVVDCLVDDRAACENAHKRLKLSGWKGLELALTQLTDKTREGLFPVNVPAAIVRGSW
jgi:hypothetical protein